jgi:hypothetical protein
LFSSPQGMERVARRCRTGPDVPVTDSRSWTATRASPAPSGPGSPGCTPRSAPRSSSAAAELAAPPQHHQQLGSKVERVNGIITDVLHSFAGEPADDCQDLPVSSRSSSPSTTQAPRRRSAQGTVTLRHTPLGTRRRRFWNGVTAAVPPAAGAHRRRVHRAHNRGSVGHYDTTTAGGPRRVRHQSPPE